MKKILFAVLSASLLACSTPAPAPKTDATHSVGPAIPKEAIQTTILSKKKLLSRCYRKSTKGMSPAPTGRFMTKFTIGADGTVTDALVGKSSLHEPKTESCVLGVIRTLQFQKPLAGATVLVDYPFEFGEGKPKKKSEQ